MADTVTTPSSNDVQTSPHARQHPGRGRGRGQSTGPGNAQQQSRSGYQRGRQGGAGRQRGGRGRGEYRHFHGQGGLPEFSTAANPGGGQTPGGSFGDRLAEDASNVEGEILEKAPATAGVAMAGEAEGDVCFICASKIDHTSVAPCNHQSCHVCALRWRALFKDRHCVVCRAPADFVIFTDDATKRFEEFGESDFVKSDDNLGIKIETTTILEDTHLLLRYNCPAADCDVACMGWPDLHRHVKVRHGKVMCDLCTRNRKAFTHEHQLFTFGDLRKHERLGDDNPGALDQSGFKGHPECGFCRQRFYGDDELFLHCREKHEKCFLCERRNEGRQPIYYRNYEDLERHFAKDHFQCIDAECQAEKFVVFDSEMDLKAHQLSRHPNGLSKDARRDARLVNMSGFEFRNPYQPARGGRGSTRRGPGGRGQDPNAEPLPLSSAQPLSRAEQAYQRTMAIQSAQAIPARSFGGQLTQPSRPTAAPQPAASEPPAMDSLTLDSSPPPPTASLTPQERARQLRHQSVTDRASRLLQNDPQKLDEFCKKVSSYRTANITAPNLIDAFFSFFDTDSAELGKLVKELAEIYETEAQREALLKAWNDWRAINEDYPSLPGPSGILPGGMSSSTIGGTGSGGKRVLKLKSSTAKSSQSAVNRQGSWGNAVAPTTAGNTSSRNNNGPAFPPLAGTDNGQKKPNNNPAAWVTSAPSRASPAPTSRPTSTKPAAASRKTNEEAFPALPAGMKPNTLMAGLTRGNVRWNDQRQQVPSVSAWGGTVNGNVPPTQAQTPAVVAAADAGGDGTKKKGGKKGKGEVLFHFG